MTNLEVVEGYLFNAKLGFSSAIIAASKTLERDGEIKPHHFKDAKHEFVNTLNQHFTNHMSEMMNQVEDEEIKNFVGKWHDSFTNRIVETTTQILHATNHPNITKVDEEVNQIFDDYGHYMRSDLQ